MDDEQIVDKSQEKSEDKPVTADDLAADKANAEGVEPETDDEPSELEESDGQSTGETAGEEADQIGDQAFNKKFPNIKGDTPQEYARNLEAAYENSTAEFHRLRKAKPDEPDEDSQYNPGDFVSLYVNQKIGEEATAAFSKIQEDYPQVSDKSEYDKFVQEVEIINQTIMAGQNRLASPAELYSKAAVILGWEPSSRPSDAEAVGMAAKAGAASAKTNSATKPKSVSKVSEAMIETNLRMYPDKSRSQIIKELEPYIK